MSRTVKTRVIEVIEYEGNLRVSKLALPTIHLGSSFKFGDEVIVIVIKKDDIIKE